MLICASAENAAMCGNAPDANEKKIEVGNVDIWINLQRGKMNCFQIKAQISGQKYKGKY